MKKIIDKITYKIIHVDDKVIKIQECPGSAYQYDVVSSIKNLNLANFYRLYDVLYIEKCGLRTFKGTISQYYSDVDINLWTERVDYVIDGFNGILNSASRLGENRILINDISLNNVILTSNGPVVIDVDDYIKDLMTLIRNYFREFSYIKRKCF